MRTKEKIIKDINNTNHYNIDLLLELTKVLNNEYCEDGISVDFLIDLQNLLLEKAKNI